MRKSIRWRLLLWYAGMLLVVIVSFASYLYWSAERSALQKIDVRLDGAARYLEAALRPFGVRALLRPMPTDMMMMMDGPPGMPRDGLSPRDGFPPREGNLRDFNDKRPPEKRQPDKRFEGDRPDRPPLQDMQRWPPDGERRMPDGERRPMPPPLREAERIRRELTLRTATVKDEAMEPLFFSIYRFDGGIFKSEDDPISNREYKVLEARLNEKMGPIFYDSASSRLALFRGPERSLILVGVSMRSELARLDALKYQLAGSGALALGLGVLGSWFISGRIKKPLQSIASTASRLSATNLEERINTDQVDTELVEVAGVLNDTFDRLESAFQRQSRFTADAGHELRTPLAILHANLELALSRPRKEAEYRETLENCLATSRQMRTLIDALLMLSRADAGQLQAHFQQIDLRDVIRNSVKQHQSRTESLLIQAIVPDQPVHLQGDATLLNMVLNNLLSNAIRHTPAQGQIHVSLTQIEGKAQITVDDTGSGIPLEAQPHLFERFFRMDQSRNRQTGGYGLGLAICKSLVEAHHGSIRCESTPGQGTRFIIDLPLEYTGQ